MRVLVSGSTGLIGSSVVERFQSENHEVTRLVRDRSETGGKAVYWSPAEQEIDREGLAGHDAVVHLAGEPIFGRWTDEKKARIRRSRVDGTRLLSRALAERETPPRVIVSASAVGYYGERGEEWLDESSGPGSGFLAEVAREWEMATQAASRKGIRVVRMRFGVVLSARGGALAAMLLPVRLGLGGVLGSGEQYMSWIALDDLVDAILHALNTQGLSGPVNTVAPFPVTNRTFTKTLGKVLNRPTFFRVPAFAARLALGEMADEALLASVRARPARLLESGFTYRFGELEPALRHLLNREKTNEKAPE